MPKIVTDRMKLPTDCLKEWSHSLLQVPKIDNAKIDNAMKGSLSYKEFWGLPEAPFENTTDPKFYFPSPKHEDGVQCLLYGIKERKGAVLLSGEIGCGKTIVSRELVLNLPQEQFDIALIANPTFEATEFLRELLYQLGIQTQGSKMDLLHHLNNHLLKNTQNGVATVVVVDEAQAIQDDRIFEELRLLLNLQLNERFLLTLVILGQPEIQDRLSAFPQFSQRIAIRARLLPLNGDETLGYIQHRLKIGGCQRPIFTKEAMLRIFWYTNGIARKINTLCDLSLLKGYLEKVHEIDEGIVERANGYTLSRVGQDRSQAMTRFSDVVRQQDSSSAERPLLFQPDPLDQFSSTRPTESDPNWYDYVQLELEHIAELVKQTKVISTEKLRTNATGIVQSLQTERGTMRNDPQTPQIRILALGSHPDDIEAGCGGTLIKYAKAGHQVFLMVMTNGERGAEPDVRIYEQNQAAMFLGAEKIYWGGYPDTKISMEQELIQRIEQVVQEVKPHFIFVHYQDDTHQDHRHLAITTMSATRYTRNVLFYEGPTTQNFSPTVFVDIDAVLEEKTKAILAHASQTGKTNIEGLLITDFVHSTAHFREFQARVKSAEGFSPLRLFINLGSS